MSAMETKSSPVSNILSGPEVMAQYASVLGKKKSESPAWKLFLLGIVAGAMVALGAVAAGTVSHAMDNAGLARMLSGLIFPFGLGMVMLMGSELFTGNTMIFISVLDKSATLSGMMKNWVCVYFGNMVGSILTAAAMVYIGQMNLGDGALAVYAIKTAISKCSISFGSGIVLGIFCNILVCLGVLCSLTAKDTTGRILGAYIPVVFFIMGGFEHCVANMYYIPAGIFAVLNPDYAALAAEAGLNTSALSWGGFVGNLIPVTIGNIIGGAGIATVLWLGHKAIRRKECHATASSNPLSNAQVMEN